MKKKRIEDKISKLKNNDIKGLVENFCNMTALCLFCAVVLNLLKDAGA